MLSRVFSYDLIGIKGYRVSVETDISAGLTGVSLVGLGDAAVREAKSRITPAIENSGYRFPYGKMVVSLAPADLKKEGSKFDLAMAVGILAACGALKCETLEQYTFLGELSLDGSVRPVTGVLPALLDAAEQGIQRFIVPKGNSAEAAFSQNSVVYPVESLKECIQFLKGETEIAPVSAAEYCGECCGRAAEDFQYVRGQASAKRAIEIAVSGGHNLLMIGPPGTGKTMLAKCIPGIMPGMSKAEALEVTKIHSVAGILDSADGVVKRRPFRTPHHTASAVALTGGGKNAKPGEISLAHHGVLFLDELPEYARHTLEAMRQPLEDGVITVSRANLSAEYPARFMLVASMNPCPCGNYGSKEKECKCSRNEIRNYLKRLSAPLLDRIDIHVEVDSVNYSDLTGKESAEPSESIRNRVNGTREVQRQRFEKDRFTCNDEMDSGGVERYCRLDSNAQSLLQAAFQKLKLSARAYTRILKVARTIADMERQENILSRHVAEAIQYRTLDRKYWEV